MSDVDRPKVINVFPLQLQFDADQITHGTPEEQAVQAIDAINRELQRLPFGLGAQLISRWKPVTVEVIGEKSVGVQSGTDPDSRLTVVLSAEELHTLVSALERKAITLRELALIISPTETVRKGCDRLNTRVEQLKKILHGQQ